MLIPWTALFLLIEFKLGLYWNNVVNTSVRELLSPKLKPINSLVQLLNIGCEWYQVLRTACVLQNIQAYVVLICEYNYDEMTSYHSNTEYLLWHYNWLC